MEAADTPDSFLTVAEVAATLKLNQQTVRNWIDQGSFPAVRIGRRVRIRRSDFERILAESYTGVSPSDSETQGPTAEDFWGGGAVGAAPTQPDSPNGTPT
jgi:excisionase family DNA binding protein